MLKEMKLTRPIFWARWLFLPSALLAMLISIPLGCAWFQEFAGHSSIFGHWYWKPFWFDVSVSTACAIAWVLIVFGMAPCYRLLVAAVSVLPGAWLAWFIMGESSFRGEGIDIVYHPTRMPTYFAWGMALTTLAALWCISKRRTKKAVTRKPVSQALGFSPKFQRL